MKYIPADKLIAEIERMKKEFSEEFSFSRDIEGAKKERLIESEIHARVKCVVCDKLIGIVDTLQQEQPKVDLEKELIQWHERHFKKTGTYEKHSGFYLENSSQLDIARHFYELGLNARKED